MATRRVSAGLASLVLLCGAAPSSRGGGPEESVVRVIAQIRMPNPIRPWAKQNPVEVAGTGVVIEGKRILTNAQLVSYATEVYVVPKDGGDRVEAKVAAIGPGIDLATLTVEEDAFFEKRPPLPRAKALPRPQSAVTAYGFPIGGDSLATTRGIVSRVEFAPFSGGGVGLLVQVDAAINPGNSGGPALVDGKMVGLVFGRDEQAEGTGFIIPNQEIDGFLDDVADGRYDGKWMPEKLHIQPLENDSLRRKIGVDRAVRGLFVRDPGPLLTSDPLRPGDILTRVGDRDIDNQGYIASEGGLRLPFSSAFEALAKDGSVPATVLREGKPNVPCRIGVTRVDDSLIRDFEGQYPSYFVVGPLVFSPLMGQAIMMYIRMNPMMAHEDSPRLLRRTDKRRTPDEELVVVTHPLLRHKVAKGYREPLGQVLDEVNGVKIRSLKHLVEVVRDAQDEFLTFRFAEKDAEVLVFNRKDLLKATEAVMSENGIARPGSDDVVAVWEKKPDPLAKDAAPPK